MQISYFTFLTRQQGSFGQKRGKQWWPCAVAGHSNFRLKRRAGAQTRRKVAAQVFPALCGIALCEKKPPADKHFCFFWCLKRKIAHAAIGHPGASFVAVIVRYLSRRGCFVPRNDAFFLITFLALAIV